MSKKILVADDDLGISEVIQIILKDHGYEVTVINDGSSVLQAMKKLLPDVVLLDLWMSGMDGHEVITEIKKDPRLLSTPIIIISALTEGEEIAQKFGANDFLAKPFNINDLVATVEKYV